jgi:hypothetical protein
MTHAESQELLLDLAYGELEPERAAAVANHLKGCAECQKDKEALEEARRLTAPLRDLEEPSSGFDDRIRAAARAQAQLEHDGNVGQVIEVTGSVRPLAVEATRIDAHGPVKARPVERHTPRWLVRAAVGGSLAIAAALALVVSTTLETRRNAEKASAARSEEYAIRVQPAAPQAVDSALRDAEVKSEGERAVAAKRETAPLPPVALQKDKVAQLRVPARKGSRSAGGASTRIEGSGGDAAGPIASRPAPAAAAAETDAFRGRASAQVPAPDGKRAASTGSPRAAEHAPSAADHATVPGAMVQAESRAMNAAAAPAPPIAPSSIEASAQQARHAGNYVLAASLYRNAAELRQRESDSASAAWNLAHAVECLSAIGQFDEARRVRDELARLYPSEITALSAARRALRELDVPSPLPAAKDR